MKTNKKTRFFLQRMATQNKQIYFTSLSFRQEFTLSFARKDTAVHWCCSLKQNVFLFLISFSTPKDIRLYQKFLECIIPCVLKRRNIKAFLCVTKAAPCFIIFCQVIHKLITKSPLTIKKYQKTFHVLMTYYYLFNNATHNISLQ